MDKEVWGKWLLWAQCAWLTPRHVLPFNVLRNTSIIF